MSGYLLDTNAISEPGKPRSNQGYMDWFRNADGSDIYLSCLCVGEVRKGVALARGTAQYPKLERYVARLYEAFEGRILDLSLKDCELWAELVAQARQAGKTPQIIDSLIAAQCLQHGLTLVTRDVRDFEHFDGLQVFSPWA